MKGAGEKEVLNEYHSIKNYDTIKLLGSCENSNEHLGTKGRKAFFY
jgi:hypothetical protein